MRLAVFHLHLKIYMSYIYAYTELSQLYALLSSLVNLWAKWAARARRVDETGASIQAAGFSPRELREIGTTVLATCLA